MVLCRQYTCGKQASCMQYTFGKQTSCRKYTRERGDKWLHADNTHVGRGRRIDKLHAAINMWEGEDKQASCRQYNGDASYRHHQGGGGKLHVGKMCTVLVRAGDKHFL
jgi:hypothetical protein